MWNKERTYFGMELYKQRTARNLTQQALAEKCGIQKQHIQCMEAGACLPSIFVYAKICDVLGLGKLPMVSLN